MKRNNIKFIATLICLVIAAFAIVPCSAYAADIDTLMQIDLFGEGDNTYALNTLSNDVTANDEQANLSTNVVNPFHSGVTLNLPNGKTATSNSYRIPSMVTLADGTIIAAADIRWNTTYDGGGLDTVVARSKDGGATWEYTVANYLGDNGNKYNYNSTSFIDHCLTVAADGKTLYMLCDLYANGVALNGDGSQSMPTTEVGFDSNGNLLLSSNNRSSYGFYLKDGKIYSSDDEEVEGYTVDGKFNLYNNGEYESNLFFADSRYKVARTGFLYLTKSTDGGATWSDPTLLNLKTSSEQVCLVGPGRGITTANGTMVFPVYSYNGSPESQRVGFVYSADNGKTWQRAQSDVNWSSEAAVVEIGEGTLRFFFRCDTKKLTYVDYDLNTEEWGNAVETNVNTNSNTQLSAITYSKTSDGKQVVLVSCPTGPNSAGSDSNDGSNRLNGRIFVGVVEADGTMTWNTVPLWVTDVLATAQLGSMPYTEEKGFFAYSCLTERADGSIAVLYENNQYGWGAGSDKYFTMNMKAFEASALGLTFDIVIEVRTCAICGEEDCTKAHLYCHVCGEFDCKKEHPKDDSYKPITEPVIPETPELTVGADVSLVDGEGNAITAETGIQLGEGMKYSFSAWSTLDDNADVTYQWQICIAEDFWVDISGQTEKGILLSPAMVNSAIQPNGYALIRCKVTSGGTDQYSDSIRVYVGQEATASAGVFRLARTANYAAAPAADTPETTTYSVVINYVFENNTPVAQSYTATLAAGSNFNATVVHPKVMGYLPYVGNATESSTQIDLNIKGIQENITYTVTYKPTNVDYTVFHYQQNVADNNYTMVERETLSGLTKSQVPEVAKTYAGFYALRYERPEIAADGSTVVEIYYDRNYYLMLFDLDGGYGTKPIYARYGAPVVVNNPTKAGYTFQGWSLDGASVDLPETVPAENVTYKALWTMNPTAPVKVVFWGENPNDEEYSYLTTGTVEADTGTEYTYTDGNTVFLICGKEEHSHTEECTLTCGKKEHTLHTNECLGCGHVCTVDCYTVGGKNSNYYKLDETDQPSEIQETPTQNGVVSYTTGSGYNKTTHYYLYLDGVWYVAKGKFSGDTYDDRQILLDCSHTHEASCYTCEVHEHTAACYSCGKEEHTHDNSCNQTGSGLDGALWKFVRSETQTVNADGSTVVNVYYDRVEYNVRFYSNQKCTNEYTELKITAKWGANILNQWPTYDGSSSWLVEGKENTWQNSIQIMPVGGAKFWGPKTGSSSYKAYYYVEALPGDTDTIEHNGVTYKLHHTDISSSKGNVTDEERYAIEGFSYKEGTANGTTYNNAKFYYTRHKYAIEFYSPTDLLQKTANVPFESPLSSYDWTPDASQAPLKYEPGSVTFEGWYLNPDCTGEKFDFTTRTMPAGTNDGDTTLTLYANWIPVTHTVEFYLDQDAMNAGTKLDSHPDVKVSHRAKVDPVPTDPENGSYEFVGWFYMDKGVETAFDFANMPITQDMKVYGKWSSNVLKEYSVYFKIKDTDTEIADPITGSGLAGATKTFDAKGGEELYEDYQEGYFPLVRSHSMTFDIENDANNTFTFWYVQKDAVPYSVYYVTETQNAAGTLPSIELDGKTYYIVADTKVYDTNRKAVVTENFVPVSGYMPDAYQKRLIIDGNDGAENKIVFFYEVDTAHAYYKITHYTQNTDGVNWTEYSSSQAIGDINTRYTASPLNIDGFTYKRIEYKVNGNVVSDADITNEGAVLTEEGLEINLYYERNKYPYEVRYLEQGTGKQLADPKNGVEYYTDVVSENAISIDGYTAVDPTSKTLAIKIEESTTEAKLNIITFYYEENEVAIDYEVVGPNGCGTVSPESETVKVLTGTVQGSTATASENYKFVGWYDNEDCTGTPISTDATFIPTKPNDGWVAATYYAKFELDVADLTITKALADGATADPNQAFVFEVKKGNALVQTVVIYGSGSVTIKNLPIAEYTVTELTDWSWRYNLQSITGGLPIAGDPSVTITLTGNNDTVKFTNSLDPAGSWLGSESYAKNIFTKTNNGVNVENVANHAGNN